MIPKEEQLDLGTQPRYTRQWGYNASTGSTSMFRRFADVFNSGAQEETRLRNALRMQIGKDIASNYVRIAAGQHVNRMADEARANDPTIASFDLSGRRTWTNPSVATVRHVRSGESTETVNKNTTTTFNYNKNYPGAPDNPMATGDSATESIGEHEPESHEPESHEPEPTDKPKDNNCKRCGAPKHRGRCTGSGGTGDTGKKDADEIQDAVIVDDGDKPTTTVDAGTGTGKPGKPEPVVITPRDRSGTGRSGADAADPDKNVDRPEKK